MNIISGFASSLRRFKKDFEIASFSCEYTMRKWITIILLTI